jgi:hypothetical protein
LPVETSSESLEARMTEAARTGEPVEPGPDTADPVSVTIRAEVLCHLLADKGGEAASRGVWLRGVWITGQLDLAGAKLNCPLRLEKCFLDGDEPVNLDYAELSAISFIDCMLPGISGKTLTVSKDLSLAGSTVTGPVQLQVATITGDLDCTGTRLLGPDDALSAAAMKVSGNVFLTGAVTTNGGIDLETANITGTLKCTGAQFGGVVKRYGNSYSLFAQWIKVGGPVRLNMLFTATHTVCLLGADISANLNCRQARLLGARIALECERMKLGGNVLAEEACTTAARITLVGAEITGNLKFTDAWLNAGACAVYGERMKVHGDVYFGTTKLQPTKEEEAQPDAQPTDKRRPYGWISLSDAEIDGNLSFDHALLNGAYLVNGVGCSVYGERLRVNGDALFDSVSSPRGAIWLRGANITGKLRWAPAEQAGREVSLADATVGRLEDDWSHANGWWPTGGLLHLEGFVYGSVSGEQLAGVQDRLAWIRSQWSPYTPKSFWAELLSYLRHPWKPKGTGRFATQPYEQLESVYQRTGQDAEARKVALDRRRDVRRYGNLTGYRKASNLLLDKAIQYGYQTWRAILALAAVYIVAVVVFWAAAHYGNLIVPLAETSAGKAAPAATQCTPTYPCFYPAGYAIDTVIPIINVHQATYWGPNGHSPWGHVLTVFTWLCTCLGWALVTLTAAGYTGLVRNSDAS